MKDSKQKWAGEDDDEESAPECEEEFEPAPPSFERRKELNELALRIAGLVNEANVTTDEAFILDRMVQGLTGFNN